MKIYLYLLPLLASVEGYAILPTTTAFSTRAISTSNHRTPTQLHYKDGDGINNNADDASSSDGSGASNVWAVLANTERWISDTLDKSNDAAKKRNQEMTDKVSDAMNTSMSASTGSSDNPYARKEVSYVCETGVELTEVVGGIFRRVREARELGEKHGRLAGESTNIPTTMRQTNVVVIPNCDEVSKFRVYDALIQAINQARRNARDFVIQKDISSEDSSAKDWVVSINCAHLHPEYGVQTPEETLTAMKHEEEEGEVDVNLQEYKKRRDEARRSPYPSIIVEVQSTPTPDFGSRASPSSASAADVTASPPPPFFAEASDGEKDTDVTSEDVRKLEALFGMSAAKKSSDDTFYDALGEAFGDKEISITTPLSMAQNWVLANDHEFDEHTSTFTDSSTRHVDAAYEFVFHTLAMLKAQASAPKRGTKSYIVLPNFLPTSATSFDRFAGQVSNIIRVMPGMTEKVIVSTFHPEHVERTTRSPVPICVITWK